METFIAIGKCPYCGSPIFENKDSYGCINYHKHYRCGFKIYKQKAGVTVTPEMAEKLLAGETLPPTTFCSKKTGEKFSGCLKMHMDKKHPELTKLEIVPITEYSGSNSSISPNIENSKKEKEEKNK